MRKQGCALLRKKSQHWEDLCPKHPVVLHTERHFKVPLSCSPEDFRGTEQVALYIYMKTNTTHKQVGKKALKWMLTTRLHKTTQFTFALPGFVSFRLSDYFKLGFRLHMGLTLRGKKITIYRLLFTQGLNADKIAFYQCYYILAPFSSDCTVISVFSSLKNMDPLLNSYLIFDW